MAGLGAFGVPDDYGFRPLRPLGAGLAVVPGTRYGTMDVVPVRYDVERRSEFPDDLNARSVAPVFHSLMDRRAVFAADPDAYNAVFKADAWKHHFRDLSVSAGCGNGSKFGCYSLESGDYRQVSYMPIAAHMGKTYHGAGCPSARSMCNCEFRMGNSHSRLCGGRVLAMQHCWYSRVPECLMTGALGTSDFDELSAFVEQIRIHRQREGPTLGYDSFVAPNRGVDMLASDFGEAGDSAPFHHPAVFRVAP